MPARGHGHDLLDQGLVSLVSSARRRGHPSQVAWWPHTPIGDVENDTLRFHAECFAQQGQRVVQGRRLLGRLSSVVM